MWSSARPENVRRMVNDIFTPQQRADLIAAWGRDTLGLTEAAYYDKVQVYKRLGLVWEDGDLQKTCPGYEQGLRWSQANTVLVDDAVEKAKAECWNLVRVPEFVRLRGGKGMVERDVLAEVVGWLEDARMWSDVSAFAAAMGNPFALGLGWRWEWKTESKAKDASHGIKGSKLPLKPEAATFGSKNVKSL